VTSISVGGTVCAGVDKVQEVRKIKRKRKAR
jgi:hypothetical protein